MFSDSECASVGEREARFWVRKSLFRYVFHDQGKKLFTDFLWTFFQVVVAP